MERAIRNKAVIIVFFMCVVNYFLPKRPLEQLKRPLERLERPKQCRFEELVASALKTDRSAVELAQPEAAGSSEELEALAEPMAASPSRSWWQPAECSPKLRSKQCSMLGHSAASKWQLAS